MSLTEEHYYSNDIQHKFPENYNQNGYYKDKNNQHVQQMSRINMLRESERRRKLDKIKNDQMVNQMNNFEGMQQLAQLANSMNDTNQRQIGIENPGYDDSNDIEASNLGLDQVTRKSSYIYKTNQNYNDTLDITENLNYDNSNVKKHVDLSKQGIRLTPDTLPPLESLDSALDSLALLSEILPNEDLIDEIDCLKHILNRSEFTETLQLYNKTVTNWQSPLGVVTVPFDQETNGAVYNNVNRQQSFKQTIEPLTTATDRLVSEVRDNLAIVYQVEAQELLNLLYSPHLQVLFPTHDEVALMREGDINENVIQKNVEQEMSQNDDIIVKPIGNSDLQVVRICKTVEALGATIKNDGDSVIISRIINGGLVDKTGQLHEGDEIIKCNGINLTGKHVDEVSNTIAESSMTGDIELVIRPTNRPAVPKNEKLTEELHVRSLFTYDPFDDVHVPCKELALKFDKGDILHITDRSDPNWWQAFRDGETGITLAGLIPSSQFEEKRQALLKSFQNKDDEERIHGKFCKRIKRNKKNKNTKQKPLPETFRTYEKMALYQQPEGKKRPIILIGASNVGRQEVRQRLLDEEKHRFQAAVPHTTRPMREGEVNGRDYYFVPKDIFVNDINEFKFIEHGIFEKHYYGTSLDSMRHIVDSGKICVIQLHAPSLLALYKTDLMPYVIFISAPNIETLREIFVSRMQKDLSDQELKETVEASMEIEKEYACYFDKVIRLTDLDRTYDELFSTINKLGQTPQWVPEIWLKRKNGY